MYYAAKNLRELAPAALHCRLWHHGPHNILDMRRMVMVVFASHVSHCSRSPPACRIICFHSYRADARSLVEAPASQPATTVLNGDNLKIPDSPHRPRPPSTPEPNVARVIHGARNYHNSLVLRTCHRGSGCSLSVAGAGRPALRAPAHGFSRNRNFMRYPHVKCKRIDSLFALDSASIFP